MSELKIEYRALDDLIPYVNNSRTHSEEQVAQVASSMAEFGFTNPILIDESGGVIAGHGRIMAARKLSYTEVPTITLAGLTDAQKKAYVIADNQLALNSGWDLEKLKLEIEHLNELDFDTELLGFDDEFMRDLMFELDPEPDADPDAAPPLAAEPISKPGDVWVLGAHRVMCGDSLDIDCWDTLMDGEKADACWTDPPYNVNYESSAGKIENDNMADEDFRQFLLDAYISMFTVMKAGAPVYVAHADTEGLNFRSAFLEAGFKLSGCLIWRKNTLVLGRSDYQWMHEPILYGWKPGSKHRWYGGRKLTTLVENGDSGPFEQNDDGTWTVRVGDDVMVLSGDISVEQFPSSVIYHEKPKRNGEHPTMKPTGLIEKMLKASARHGDIIIDAFGGSGSTMIAADRLGMCSRLMEYDPKFVDVIVKRWQDYTGRKAVHAETGEKFPETD